MIVPFYRPPEIPEKDLEMLKEEMGQVLSSGLITNGEKCRQFEDQVRKLHGADYAIACSNCTSGISMVLQALNSKVICLPSFTWKSISYITQQYNKVWQDIDPETWLQTKIETPKKVDTHIILNTFGSVSPFTADKEVKTVYDGAFSLGCRDAPIGDALVMSTTATKPVTSCEGGLILTNQASLATKLMEQRSCCARMSEVHAVIGLYYLKRIREITEKKQKIFTTYHSKLPYASQAIPIATSYGYYAMLVENRDLLLEKLQGKIECRVRYTPLVSGLPNSDYVAKHILCLPCYPNLDPSTVVNSIREATE